MISHLKKDFLKFEYHLIFLTSILISVALCIEYYKDKKSLLLEKKQYQIDNYFKPKKRQLTLAFSTLYQNIRTISLLPSIRGIQSGNRVNDTVDLVAEGKFSKEGAETFQQIYNNLASNINVSEVYCIVDGFNPEKKEVPALMYDNLIIDPKREKQKEGEQNKIDPDTPEEYEEDEYLEYVDQLHAFKKKSPQFIFKTLDEIPAISSRPLRTCDNSQYISKKEGNIHNAMGITYSVPFYDETNHFKGIISAIIRLNIFEAILLDVPFIPITKQDEIIARNSGWTLPKEESRFVLMNKKKNIVIFDRRNDLILQDISDRGHNNFYSEEVPTKDFDSTWVLYYKYNDKVIVESLNSIFFSFIIKIIFIIIISGIIITTRWKSNKNSDQINKIGNTIKNITKNISEGNFEVGGYDNNNDIEFKYQIIIKNINQLIESFITPLIEISNKLEVFGHGKIPEKIAQNWPGKFNEVKNNFNTLNNLLTSLIVDIKTISEKSSQGDLKIRLKSEHYLGEFQKIALGMNSTLSGITTPLEEAMRVIKGLSQQDFTNKIEAQFAGDWNEFKENINMAIDGLKETLSLVVQTSVDIKNDVEKINQGAELLSQGATDQASSLEEISSSLSEVSSQAGHNSSKAQSVQDLISKSFIAIQESEKLMREMNSSMEKIDSSSNDISKIIKVIDEIAFQTNILALNAAVEAARAGKHGRGFSIVAQEVRRLAIRSADAAKETTELINSSKKRIEEGSEISLKTAGELHEILSAISNVSSLISEITKASQNQFASIQQINIATQQVSNVTQNSSAQSQKIVLLVHNLEKVTNHLNSVVKKFKLYTLTV